MRKYRLSIVVVLAALGVWYGAFYILTGYRKPDVPFVTTPPAVVNTMIELGAIGPTDTVYDLGCGDGRLVIAATKRYPTIRGVGIDIDPERTAEARTAATAAGVADRVTIIRNDLFREDISGANVVLMYLMASINERLIPQFNTMKPGSRIVSHAFRIPGIKAKETRQISVDGLDHSVYLYITPLERE
jgi:trans-aconitate methyltransferase